MPITADKVYTLSLKEYCDSHNINLQDYEVRGVHYEDSRSLFSRKPTNEIIAEKLLPHVPEHSEVVVALQHVEEGKKGLLGKKFIVSGTALIPKVKPRDLSAPFIKALYTKYAEDLLRVRERQQAFYTSVSDIMKPALDDIEAEITYLLLREYRPETIVEISPYGGWSTSWILNALADNDTGQLYSFDMINLSRKIVPLELSEDRWHFIQGDIKESHTKVPESIDYLFMDSDHSAAFADWYVKTIFPKVKPGSPVSVHDIYHRASPLPEGEIVIDWLTKRGADYFTPSPLFSIDIFNELMSHRDSIGISTSIHSAQNNPMIFFCMP
jgi:predicted O-methyltransferase YrrM